MLEKRETLPYRAVGVPYSEHSHEVWFGCRIRMGSSGTSMVDACSNTLPITVQGRAAVSEI
jgi:hypothetical protein